MRRNVKTSHPNFSNGVRSVLFQGPVPSDVFSITRSVPVHSQEYKTTYQDTTDVTHKLTSDGTIIRVYEYDRSGSINEVIDDEKEAYLSATPKLLLEWLLDADTQHHTNYLPVGFGWDGIFTRSEHSKRRHYAGLFEPRPMAGSSLDREWLSNLLDDITRTPTHLLCNSWTLATHQKERRVPARESLVVQEFVYFHTNGNVSYHRPRKVLTGLAKHPGVSVPNDVEKMIILTREQLTHKSGEDYGTKMSMVIFEDAVE